MNASVYLHLGKNHELETREVRDALYITTKDSSNGLFVEDEEVAWNLAQILRSWVEDRDIKFEAHLEEVLDRR